MNDSPLGHPISARAGIGGSADVITLHIPHRQDAGAITLHI